MSDESGQGDITTMTGMQKKKKIYFINTNIPEHNKLSICTVNIRAVTAYYKDMYGVSHMTVRVIMNNK